MSSQQEGLVKYDVAARELWIDNKYRAFHDSLEMETVYLAKPVDQMLTKALALARRLQKEVERTVPPWFLNQDDDWKAAQRFVEEFGND